MTFEKTHSLIATIAALIMAALFALALAGCGDQSSSSTSAADSGSSAESAASADEITIPEDLAEANEAVKSIVESGDTSAAEDLSTLAAREGDDVDKVEASDIETGEVDESKVPTSSMFLQEGGVQIFVPSSWVYTRDNDGFVMQTRDASVVGWLSSFDLGGKTVDLESLAASVPASFSSKGFSNVKIVDYGTCYSSKGTLCSAYIMITATKGGGDHVIYHEFIQSKSYLNSLEFGAPIAAFNQNSNDIKGVVNSLSFVPGEEI